MGNTQLIPALPKILLVEDDKAFQTVLKYHLEKEGFEVHTANNGTAAKALVGLQDFKAVISDIKMPGDISGLDLLEHIQRAHPTLPVVLMTGLEFETKDAIILGAKAFLAKPFRREELIRALRNDCQISIDRVISGKAKKFEIQEFIKELSGFAKMAEEILSSVESNIEENQGMLLDFSELMLAIRGTTEQLSLPEIAMIARLGEEIAAQAVHAVHADGRQQIRKCIDCLWDALSIVKYLLQHYEEEIEDDKQDILINRLLSTLKASGDARPAFEQNEIETLLQQRK